MLPYRASWVWLLIASCYFYMVFSPLYILILFALILIDYAAGILIENSVGRREKKGWLVFSLVSNLGILFFFKYYNFFAENLSWLTTGLGSSSSLPHLEILLPIGLSFHTFQSLSYTIEVFRGNHKAEKHLGCYALYVLFFPQLVAGPIERPQNLLPQLKLKKSFDESRVVSGLALMLWGMFKKVVIADRMALLVNPIFDDPRSFDGPVLLLGSILFAFQIYADFSGYSDIAIGAARVLGFNLMRNFNAPYMAKSVSEFWRRWHISLTTWFKEYLYDSLFLWLNSYRFWAIAFCLLGTFLLSGLWHGANWTYVIWGGLNGIFLIAGLYLEPVKAKVSRWSQKIGLGVPYGVLQVASTFLLICFAWIFFRAKNVSDAVYIVTHLPVGWAKFGEQVKTSGVGFEWKTVLSLGILVFVSQYLEKNLNVWDGLRRLPFPMRWSAYYALLATILYVGYGGGSERFIYFQF